MAMTWGIKVQKVAFALAVVAALALASGANWVEAMCGLSW
jgi:hypothetical protein